MNASTQGALFDRFGGPATETKPARTVATTPTPTRPVFRNRAPIAANADPVSSHLAGAAITESGSRNNQKAALLRWLRGAREPLTSAEIAAAGGFDRHGTARRLPDLADDGHVERSGKRTCRQTGAADCITWRVADGDSTARQHEPLANPDATGSTSAPEPTPASATCPCKGTGRIRISTAPTIWVFCDEARGKACIHAERRRRVNPDPNHDLSSSAPEVLAR